MPRFGSTLFRGAGCGFDAFGPSHGVSTAAVPRINF